jgi:transposase InsO family protein
MVDRTTGILVVMPLKNTEATSSTAAFPETWIARFGVAAVVTTDRGSQLTCHMWTSFCKKLGVNHILTTAFHPQNN